MKIIECEVYIGILPVPIPHDQSLPHSTHSVLWNTDILQ